MKHHGDLCLAVLCKQARDMAAQQPQVSIIGLVQSISLPLLQSSLQRLESLQHLGPRDCA